MGWKADKLFIAQKIFVRVKPTIRVVFFRICDQFNSMKKSSAGMITISTISISKKNHEGILFNITPVKLLQSHSRSPFLQYDYFHQIKGAVFKLIF